MYLTYYHKVCRYFSLLGKEKLDLDPYVKATLLFRNVLTINPYYLPLLDRCGCCEAGDIPLGLKKYGHLMRTLRLFTSTSHSITCGFLLCGLYFLVRYPHYYCNIHATLAG